MKVQINLKVASKTDVASAFDLVVGVEDTVLSAKERIAAAQLVAFPEQDLMFEGEVLEASWKLSDCGVKDGSALDFVVRASEASLVKQLTELLQARDLSPDELGLLYCYKHGVSINQALKSLAYDGKFHEFLKSQKQFLLENGLVSLVRAESKLKPISVKKEVEAILEAAGGSLSITEVCSKFVQKFNTSISDVVGVRPAEFLEKERDLFVVTGRGLVSLKGAVPELPPGLGGPSGRDGVPPWSRARVAPEPTPAPVEEEPAPVDGQQYLELHNKISGRSFNSKIAQTLNDIVDVVSQRLFLKAEHVVKGGAVGKGTAITGVPEAEIVMFLAGMPAASINKWLPPLLKAANTVLNEHLASGEHATDVRVVGDALQLTAKGLVKVDLRFAPTFVSYEEALETLRSQRPQTRKLLAASLAKEKVQFVGKQPGQVKVTMRLLKWWRDQQEWSSSFTRPSDEILELVAVYSAVQTKSADQHQAIASAMSLLARFEELRVVWSNYYGKDDIWAPLLHHRPLLMDPTNPYVNVADPQNFDAAELMKLAKTTHFFW